MTPSGLKRLRAALGLTQKSLGEKLGVDRNTVVRWEMGLHPISPIAEKFLAHLANCSTS